MISTLLLLACLSAAAATPVSTSRHVHKCHAPAANLSIHQAHFYPENADFDRKRCVTYFRYGVISNVVSFLLTL